MARLAPQLRDQRDAAAVVLVGGVVEASGPGGVSDRYMVDGASELEAARQAQRRGRARIVPAAPGSGSRRRAASVFALALARGCRLGRRLRSRRRCAAWAPACWPAARLVGAGAGAGPPRGSPRARPSGRAPARAPRPAAGRRSPRRRPCARSARAPARGTRRGTSSGSKSRRQRVDQLLGHRQLAVGGLGLGDASSSSSRSGGSTSSPNSIVVSVSTSPVGRSAHSCCLERSTTRPIADLARLAHRVEQQPVGLGAAGGRREVVGVVVVDRVDLGEIDELLDVDRLRRLRIERVELVGSIST